MNNIVSQVEEFVVYNEVNKNHGRPEDFIDGDLGDRLEEFKYYNIVKNFDLRSLNKEEWDVCDDTVLEYEEKIKQKNIKNIKKIVISDKKSIIDGVHRLNAFLNLGVFFVDIYVGTNDEVKEFGLN